MNSPLTVIRNATVILPDRLLPAAGLVMRDGRILEIGKDRTRVPRGAVVVEARGGYLAPGFVDLHVHGGGGARTSWMYGRGRAHGLPSARASRHDHDFSDHHHRIAG